MTIIKNAVSAVNADSIANDLDIKIGDCLISINHAPVIDIFDFRTRTAVTSLLIEIEKQNGERILFDIEKDEYEDLGIEFENSLMDKGRDCRNKCDFCFIDQLPQGLRESLYFKDDDLRLSFLTGNYVTLTNLEDEELDRLVSYRLSPMNISVHTTNPALRVEMMKNKNAGKILSQLTKITQAGIWVNCQIVLCPGINDGEFLTQTLKDLFDLGECIKSIALVPVGLTRFRSENKVRNLLPFGQSSARRIIEIVTNYQQIMKQNRGERIVFASDEFYIKAGITFPAALEYDEFPQLENGVGMVPLFIKEMKDGLKKRLKQIEITNAKTNKNNNENKSTNANTDAKANINMGNKTAGRAEFVNEKNSLVNKYKSSDELNATNEMKAMDGIKASNKSEIATSLSESNNLPVLLITGVDAMPYLEMFVPDLSQVYSRKFVVKAIKNLFFGESVTVTGLVTGSDIISELSNLKSGELYENVIIPSCMLRFGEDVFLDDLSVQDVSKAVGIAILQVDSTGKGFLNDLDRIYCK